MEFNYLKIPALSYKRYQTQNFVITAPSITLRRQKNVKKPSILKYLTQTLLALVYYWGFSIDTKNIETRHKVLIFTSGGECFNTVHLSLYCIVCSNFKILLKNKD